MIVLFYISLALCAGIGALVLVLNGLNRLRDNRLEEYGRRLAAEPVDAELEEEALAAGVSMPVGNPAATPMPKGYDMVSAMGGNALASVEMGRDHMQKQWEEVLAEVEAEAKSDEKFYVEALKEAIEEDPKVAVHKVIEMLKTVKKPAARASARKSAGSKKPVKKAPIKRTKGKRK